MQDSKEINRSGKVVRHDVDVAYGDRQEIVKQLDEREREFRDNSDPKNSVKISRQINIKGHHRCLCGSGKLFKNCCKRRVKPG